MNKIVYFDNDDQRVDRCSGQIYLDLLDYAFERSDYFMLAYVNYYGEGYGKIKKEFRDLLRPYQVKTRTTPHWPGTPSMYCANSTYKVVFYRNDPGAKEILKKVEKLSDWSRPLYPEDLSFFKGNKCWFYSVGHEKMGTIVRATGEDVRFALEKGLATSRNIKDLREQDERFYNGFDEILERER